MINIHCPQCDKDGKLFKGIKKIINQDYQKSYKDLDKKTEYLTYQCETRTQLRPIELKPVTRFMCSNKHQWSV